MKKVFRFINMRRRQVFRTLFGFFSLSGMLFVFQACYGTPQDFGMDVLIKGKVISAENQAGIHDIKISIDGLPQYTRSSGDGSFGLFVERASQYRIIFTDTDGQTNGFYAEKDTLLSLNEDQEEISLTIALQ